MPDSKRPIPIPWKVRLKYLGMHWLQGILFLGCLLALAWLWAGRVSNIALVGQVEVVQVSVPSTDAGVLMNLEEPLSVFDHVDKDVTLIARIDVSDALNEMQTLNAERQRLQSLIASESERLRLEQRKRNQDQQQQKLDVVQHDLDRQRNRIGHRDQVDELRREVSELYQRRRDLDLRQAELSAQRITDQQELTGLQRQRSQLDELVGRNMASSVRLVELDSQIALQQQAIRQSEQVLTTVQTQIGDLDRELADAQSRWGEASQAWQEFVKQDAESNTAVASSEETVADAETLLEPLARALAVQDAKVQALAHRIASNEIRAPVSGMIAKVHQPPGTYVRSGDLIVTIASERSQWIVAYVDQRQRGVLRPLDKIEIRMRGANSGSTRVGIGTVVSFGAQFEVVPEHLRRNPEIVQWGLPLRIAIPDGLAMVPGELVDLVFSFAEFDARLQADL